MTSTILVINGPNLNRLGKRRPEKYGTTTLQDVIDGLEGVASQLGVKILHKQSNTEGELLDWLHEHMDADGVIVNPAGLTLYGRPLHDAVADFKDEAAGAKPVAIVHIAQLYRHGDVYGPATQDIWKATADVYVCGLGINGYNAALVRLHELITGETTTLSVVKRTVNVYGDSTKPTTASH